MNNRIVELNSYVCIPWYFDIIRLNTICISHFQVLCIREGTLHEVLFHSISISWVSDYRHEYRCYILSLCIFLMQFNGCLQLFRFCFFELFVDSFSHVIFVHIFDCERIFISTHDCSTKIKKNIISTFYLPLNNS